MKQILRQRSAERVGGETKRRVKTWKWERWRVTSDASMVMETSRFSGSCCLHDGSWPHRRQHRFFRRLVHGPRGDRPTRVSQTSVQRGTFWRFHQLSEQLRAEGLFWRFEMTQISPTAPPDTGHAHTRSARFSLLCNASDQIMQIR